MKLEVHTSSKGHVFLQNTDGNVSVYDEASQKFTDEIYDLIASEYPDALTALSGLYKKSKPNFPHFKYKVVSRFLRCNMGGYDDKLDLDSNGIINLELVTCPLRGECEYENIICKPRRKHLLSPREYDVMKLFCEGKTAKEIAAILYIAEHTCNKHKQNAKKKAGSSSMADFMHYAESHHLFD